MRPGEGTPHQPGRRDTTSPLPQGTINARWIIWVTDGTDRNNPGVGSWIVMTILKIGIIIPASRDENYAEIVSLSQGNLECKVIVTSKTHIDDVGTILGRIRDGPSRRRGVHLSNTCPNS